MVKRNKNGLTLNLTWNDWLELLSTIEAIEIPSRIKSDESIHNALHAVVLRHMFMRKRTSFIMSSDCRVTITWAESIALMWHLRKYDDSIAMLNLKSAIHKHLQG